MAIDLMRGRPATVAAALDYKEFLLSSIVLGEMVAGAQGARNSDAELERLEIWREHFDVVSADEDTAYLYGELIGELESHGKRIPTNDIWIAAIAVQYGLPLLARDEHFRRLSRLQWVGY